MNEKQAFFNLKADSKIVQKSNFQYVHAQLFLVSFCFFCRYEALHSQKSQGYIDHEHELFELIQNYKQAA